MTAADDVDKIGREGDVNTFSAAKSKDAPRPNRTSITKRTHARCSLTARLRDRIQNEIQALRPISILDPIDGEKLNEGTHHRSLTNRARNFGPSRNSTSVIRHVPALGSRHLSHGKRPPDKDENRDSVGSNLIQYMTISQVRRILNARTSKQRGDVSEASSAHLPDIKIKISSVPDCYPNIKVTMDRNDTLNFKSAAGRKRDPREPKSSVNRPAVNKSVSKKDSLPIVLAPASRTRSAPVSQSDRQTIEILDRQRMHSADKTRKWILDNPLGPEENEDYGNIPEMDLKKHAGSEASTEDTCNDTKTDRSTHVKKPGESKRVRFCSDKWLLKDESYMFD